MSSSDTLPLLCRSALVFAITPSAPPVHFEEEDDKYDVAIQVKVESSPSGNSDGTVRSGSDLVFAITPSKPVIRLDGEEEYDEHEPRELAAGVAEESAMDIGSAPSLSFPPAAAGSSSKSQGAGALPKPRSQENYQQDRSTQTQHQNHNHNNNSSNSSYSNTQFLLTALFSATTMLQSTNHTSQAAFAEHLIQRTESLAAQQGHDVAALQSQAQRHIHAFQAGRDEEARTALETLYARLGDVFERLRRFGGGLAGLGCERGEEEEEEEEKGEREGSRERSICNGSGSGREFGDLVEELGRVMPRASADSKEARRRDLMERSYSIVEEMGEVARRYRR